MRFYYKDNSKDEAVKHAISALVLQAEYRSETICEKCGKYGQTVLNNGIIETLCEAHQRNNEE